MATAGRLLRVQGYHATGLNQIIEDSQAPKGSLYHYFPQGKEELACEAIVEAGKQMGARLRSLMEDSPSDALAKLVEMTIRDLETSDFRDGCPIATVSLETTNTSPALQHVCAHIFDGAIKMVEAWLLKLGVDADQAAALAVTTFSAYEGALVLSKVRRDTQPLKQVSQQMAHIISLFIPK